MCECAVPGCQKRAVQVYSWGFFNRRVPLCFTHALDLYDDIGLPLREGTIFFSKEPLSSVAVNYVTDELFVP